jgi:two-component system, OmpR family, response regulator
MTRQVTQFNVSEKRVIIVESDNERKESLLGHLSDQGYKVTGVGSAGDFYQLLFSSERCDLAVIDIGLPDQSGFVLAEYVRKNTDAWIIVLYSGNSVEERLAGYESGADLCMAKPVDVRELEAVITNMFHRMDALQSPQFKTTVSHEPAAVEEESGSWKLMRNEWSLLTPHGDSIALTAKEFDFMLSLVLQSSAIVTRQYILKILGYQPNEQGNRALESLIYRLRRKTETFGYGFPIKTYRGVGYCLAVPVLLS